MRTKGLHAEINRRVVGQRHIRRNDGQAHPQAQLLGDQITGAGKLPQPAVNGNRHTDDAIIVKVVRPGGIPQHTQILRQLHRHPGAGRISLGRRQQDRKVWGAADQAIVHIEPHCNGVGMMSQVHRLAPLLKAFPVSIGAAHVAIDPLLAQRADLDQVCPQQARQRLDFFGRTLGGDLDLLRRRRPIDKALCAELAGDCKLCLKHGDVDAPPLAQFGQAPHFGIIRQVLRVRRIIGLILWRVDAKTTQEILACKQYFPLIPLLHSANPVLLIRGSLYLGKSGDALEPPAQPG